MLCSKVQGSDGQQRELVEVIPKLPADVLEDITVRSCFVTTLPRARQLAAAKTNGNDGDQIQPPTPPPTILYPLSGNKNLILEGSIREETAEILFETDNEITSLASMVLDSILLVSADVLFLS